VRSVERLPPYSSSPKQLKYPVLVIGNTVRSFHAASIPYPHHNNFQADPVSSFANAQKIANLFGEDAFLIEQLGFGHSSIAQTSLCSLSVVADFIANSTVGL
jgi:hypothetical protein